MKSNYQIIKTEKEFDKFTFGKSEFVKHEIWQFH